MSDLDKIRETVFNKYWEYDYEDNSCKKADEVLKDIQNIKNNPLLFGYIIECMAKNGFEVDSLSCLYYVELQVKRYDAYKPIEELQRKEGLPGSVYNKIGIDYNDKSIFKGQKEALDASVEIRKNYINRYGGDGKDVVAIIKPITEVVKFKSDGGSPWKEKHAKNLENEK
jgi:hypothetical protein